MKNIVTAVCCISLGIYGLYSGSHKDITIKPQNTVSAASLSKPLTPIRQVVHDTIAVPDTTKRDTVHKIITKTRTRIKRVPYPVRDTVSILYIKTREARKGTPPDTIPRKFVVHDAVDVTE